MPASRVPHLCGRLAAEVRGVSIHGVPLGSPKMSQKGAKRLIWFAFAETNLTVNCRAVATPRLPHKHLSQAKVPSWPVCRRSAVGSRAGHPNVFCYEGAPMPFCSIGSRPRSAPAPAPSSCKPMWGPGHKHQTCIECWLAKIQKTCPGGGQSGY